MAISVAGFKLTDKKVAKRLLVSIAGMEKTGKTHWALTAPGPIVVFDMDLGLEGVVNRFPDKTILFSRYEYNIPEKEVDRALVSTLTDPIWARFLRDYQTALKDPLVKTIVWDTATEVWELLRLARLGKIAQVRSIHYGPVNAEFRKLARGILETQKNLILIHKMKPVYADEKPTGNFEVAGFGDIGGLVQANLETSFTPEDGFILSVKNCKQNMDLCGLSFAERDNQFSFPAFASLVFGEEEASFQ